MTSKLKALEDLRDRIKQGRLSDRDHARLYFHDVNGRKVFVTSDNALEAIEARIEAEKDVSEG